MQKSFCAKVMLTVFAATSVAQADSNEYLNSFRDAGRHVFSVHGAFRDLVVKAALHEFVKEQLPNSPFFSLGSQDFDLQDIFIALSDALAEVTDAQFMG